MCPIVDGQPVNAAVTNNEKLDRQSDDTAFGIISLDNSDPESGATIENTQRAINRTMTAAGVNETTEDGMSYSPVPADTITDGDSHELALRKLSNLFQGITGHNHDGTDGNGPTLFTPPATTGANGGVTLPSADPLDVSGVPYLGSSGSTIVALADHQHRGVRSLSVSGDSELFGDIVFKPGLNIDLSQASGTPNEIEIIGNITSVSGADIDGAMASNTSRITIPKDTKANLDALTRKEGTVVYSTDTDKLYYDDGTILKPVGSGSGGGINFMPLSTTWSSDNQDNVDFETTIGNWVTYDNGAVAIPTTMTGGSPSQVTISRTTSAGQVLNGSASMLISKSAADAQGEGISCVLNVPPGYSGKRALINIPYRVTSGSLVQGDVKVFVYDVTNSVLITPFNNDLVGSNGTIQAMYDVPNSTANVQMRLGFHFCTTSTTAVTFVFDDVNVGPLDIPATSVVTKPKKYTPVFGGCSPTSIDATYTIDGNNMIITGSAVMGSAAGSAFTMSLPDGYAPDGPIGGYSFAGRITRGNTGDPSARSLIYTGDDALLRMGQTASPLSPTTANVIANAEAFFFGPLVIPLKNISNATLTQTSNFYLSQILATGTRVTSTPTKLGEYRTWQKSSSAVTGVDTAPNTLPSAANGMAIGAYVYATAGSGTFNISAYEVFIGQNKNYKMQLYESAGRTGLMSEPGQKMFAASSVQYGIAVGYNPTTGVLSIDASPHSNSITGANVLGYKGTSASTGTDSSATGYWDAIISESASPMSIVTPNSSVTLHTGINANGSTNTTVRRFGTVVSEGNALTATQSTTDGDLVNVNEKGIYTISFTDVATATTSNYAAITINGSALTTDPSSLTYAQGFRAGSYNASDEMWFVGSVNIPLVVGDVIRFQRSNSNLSTSSRVVAIVTQTSKG